METDPVVLVRPDSDKGSGREVPPPDAPGGAWANAAMAMVGTRTARRSQIPLL
jgi:hypothetical protein